MTIDEEDGNKGEDKETIFRKLSRLPNKLKFTFPETCNGRKMVKQSLTYLHIS